MEKQYYNSYSVWDLPTRLFHWINVLCVIAMICLGTIILWGSALGLNSDGKLLIKTIHVYVGYVFAINLIIRLMWAFMGNRFARWNSFLPFGRNYLKKLKGYLTAEKEGKTQFYLGHNPLGKLAVSAILLSLVIMATTGLVLAGTDIYFPPFGTIFQQWIAASGVNPADVVSGVKDNVDVAAYAEMRSFRKPFISLHNWFFYVIIGLIFIHIGAVIFTEIKSGANLISAMFTGKKILTGEPEDKEE
mgnify:CR=1 FL=1